MIRLLAILALLLQPTEPTLTVTHEGQALRVTWSAPEPVCPWLEWGSLRAYAGGALPCRASGSALVTLVPDVGARVVLRRADGSEVAAAGVEYVAILPLIAKPQQSP